MLRPIRADPPYVNRAGVAASRRARQERRHFLRTHLGGLTALLGGFIFLAGLVLTFGPPMGRWFLTTAFAVGLVVVTFVVLTLDGAQSTRDGAEAERRSSHALRRLGKTGWRVVNNVNFLSMDIDHVAIGPDGVVAVETKYVSSASDVTDEGRAGFLGRPVDQAKLGARRIRLLLKSEGMDVAVAPALAVWGPGSFDLKDDVIDGVVVLLGRDSKVWQKQLPGTGQGFSASDIETIERTLLRFAAPRDRRDRHAGRTGLPA